MSGGSHEVHEVHEVFWDRGAGGRIDNEEGVAGEFCGLKWWGGVGKILIYMWM